MIEDVIQVKVNTPKGERIVEYKKVNLDYETEWLCDTKCPYWRSKLNCTNLRDPRNPENKDSFFLNFCQENAPDDKNNKCFYVPVEGTLEKNLGDIVIKNEEED